MLGQIANFCPVVARNTIVKNSTSMQSIWQAIRAHFGLQATGARFLDFNNLHLEPGERPARTSINVYWALWTIIC